MNYRVRKTMNYRVDRKTVKYIRCKLNCTKDFALFVYDIAHHQSHAKKIKLEEAVEFVIFKFSPKEPCEEVF